MSYHLPPAPQPKPLRWAGTLTYLQFVPAVLAAVYSVLAASKANETPVSDPGVDLVPALGYGGLMALLAVAALLSAVLLSRRDRWVRTYTVAVQIGFAASVVAAPLLLLSSHILVLVGFTVPCAGMAILAAVNLVLLSRPTVSQWYAREG